MSPMNLECVSRPHSHCPVCLFGWFCSFCCFCLFDGLLLCFGLVTTMYTTCGCSVVCLQACCRMVIY